MCDIEFLSRTNALWDLDNDNRALCGGFRRCLDSGRWVARLGVGGIGLTVLSLRCRGGVVALLRNSLRHLLSHFRDVNQYLLSRESACWTGDGERVALEVHSEVLSWLHASGNGDVHTLHSSRHGCLCRSLHDVALHNDAWLLHNDWCCGRSVCGPNQRSTIEPGPVETGTIAPSAISAIVKRHVKKLLWEKNAGRRTLKELKKNQRRCTEKVIQSQK